MVLALAFPISIPKEAGLNVDRLLRFLPPPWNRKHVELPEIYTTVPAVAMAKSKTVVPEVKVEQTKVYGF